MNGVFHGGGSSWQAQVGGPDHCLNLGGVPRVVARLPSVWPGVEVYQLTRTVNHEAGVMSGTVGLGRRALESHCVLAHGCHSVTIA